MADQPAAAPFVFISTLKVKDGKLAQFKEHVKQLVELVEAKEPRLIAFNIYLDEEAGRTTLVQVHPDAASMGFHMGVVAEHMSGVFDYLDEESAYVLGPDSDGVVDMIKQWTEPHVALTVMPVHAGGFARTSAG